MIELRAWDLWEEEMLNDIHFTWQDCGFKSLNDCLNSERFVFQQFTGLMDKNDVKIYEGDIIRFKYPYDKRHTIVGVIMWSPNKAGMGIYLEQTSEVYDLYRVTADNFLRVVGNIYEDKEMLTKWLAKKILKDS